MYISVCGKDGDMRAYCKDRNFKGRNFKDRCYKDRHFKDRYSKEGYSKDRYSKEGYGKYIRVLYVSIAVLAVITGSAGCKAESSGNPSVQVGNVGQEPPAMKLSDILSSTMNEFEVTSGNYQWNYPGGDGMTGAVACGAHPLFEAKDKETLKLPRYNGQNTVSYAVSFIIQPDRLTVYEYSIEDMEGTDASPLSSAVYEDALMPEFKVSRVYELVAEWDEEHLEKNGCFGTASYVVVTE